MAKPSVVQVANLIQRLKKWQSRRRRLGLRTKELQEAQEFLMDYAITLLNDRQKPSALPRTHYRARMEVHWQPYPTHWKASRNPPAGTCYYWCRDCQHSCFHECCCVCGGHLG